MFDDGGEIEREAVRIEFFFTLLNPCTSGSPSPSMFLGPILVSFVYKFQKLTDSLLIQAWLFMFFRLKQQWSSLVNNMSINCSPYEYASREGIVVSLMPLTTSACGSWTAAAGDLSAVASICFRPPRSEALNTSDVFGRFSPHPWACGLKDLADMITVALLARINWRINRSSSTLKYVRRRTRRLGDRFKDQLTDLTVSLVGIHYHLIAIRW